MNEHRKSPIHTEDQEFPEPERLVTPEEEAGRTSRNSSIHRRRKGGGRTMRRNWE